MSGSTISTKVTIGALLGITLGSGTYASPLTITPSGDIAPSAYGATALSAGIGAGYVLNQGTIAGCAGGGGGTGASHVYGGAGGAGGTGVYLVAGGLTNDGTIVGGTGGIGGTGYGAVSGTGGIGVLFHSGGTLIDAGFVRGGSGAGGTADAVYFGSGASRLILDPAASFSGAVYANASFSNTLELASAGGAGTIAGLGDSITGFGTLQLDPGAAWFIQGNSAGLAAGQTIDGFAPGDTLELTGFVTTSDSFIGSGLVLSGTSGSASIGIQGSLITGNFAVTNDGTNSFVEVACFAAGTRIATQRGDIAVETLRVGEMMRVLPSNGPAPVIWIGHRLVNCARHRRPHQVWPVRIAAGTFGPGRPCRDLFLSPDHAVFVADVLIPVKYLVNGSTIVQVSMDEVTYYHVELPRHSLLLAEALAVESYLDTGDCGNFANGGGPVVLHPDLASRVWEAGGCAPLIVTGPQLDAARRLVRTHTASRSPSSTAVA